MGVPSKYLLSVFQKKDGNKAKFWLKPIKIRTGTILKENTVERIMKNFDQNLDWKPS